MAAYVSEYNDVMPHSALGCATPLEVVTGRWTSESRNAMEAQQRQAVATRQATNRALACLSCVPGLT
jgi:hypothetical protein